MGHGRGKSAAALTGALFGCLAVSAAAQKAPAPVDFAREIRPLLAANCFACHGHDPATRKANLRLDRRDEAQAKRAVVPGDPARSALLARVDAADPALRMPPPGSGRTLTAAQKRLLARWVAQGAPYSPHWAFAPIDPSAGRQAGGIDGLLRARLARAGLKLRPEADRYTLIRRLSLDLIGLPPTPEEVTAFVQDRSPGAYEKVVDRLLASPRYGEHWARMWLDLARYADTKGYEKDQPRSIWRYRDWVIDAFDADMPYDRFTIEQLAGDLLPAATDSQILATAFHRNTMCNDEGGTDDEEFRTVAVKDRVDTTIQVWMGLTMGCAKCHSHKYDPVSQADYYRFYALFNQTEDADRYDDAPTVPTPTAEQKARREALDGRLATLRDAFWKPSPMAAAQQASWERELAARTAWNIPPPRQASARSGATLTRRADGALLVSGKRAEKDVYEIALPLPAGPVTALRLEALKDASLPNGGPGRDPADQNAVVSEVKAFWLAPDGRRIPAPLTHPRADFEQDDWLVAHAIDGNPETGWAWYPQNAQPHIAVFDLKEPLPGGGTLIVQIEHGYPNLALGCLRVAVSSAPPATLLASFHPLEDLAALPREKRSDDDQRALDRAFRLQFAELAAGGRELDTTEKERAALEKQTPRTPIFRELPDGRRRATRVHQRGNFLEPGDEVTPAVLSEFGALPAGAPLNRLGAAQWLVAKENPLTARVAVNRIWARLFGVGLVETEEDFGTQGAQPSHPELLDYLAAAFRDELGWSQKKLLKRLAMSAAYRQGARTDPGALRLDPRNRLLSHSPRYRLSAEVLRDQALAIAGLLSAKKYGPSTMPPQPEGVWRAVYSGLKWEVSPGEDRYRRALYTFWRRTSPYPALTTFDAGSGEVCTLRRVRTNTPLQALVTLNDPAFVEAAGALGRRMATEGGASVRARIVSGFRRAAARPPSAAETARLERLFRDTLAGFRRRPDDARALLKDANLSLAPADDPGLLAAWTVVGNVLLNLDEVLTRP